MTHPYRRSDGGARARARLRLVGLLLLAPALARAEAPPGEAPTPRAASTAGPSAPGAASPPARAGKYEEGKAALQAKDLDLAERLMSEAIAADPHDARAWNGRGVVRSRRGDLDGAVADVERAIAIRDDAQYRYHAAQYELARRRWGPARTHARRCVELDPRRARAWALLADVEMIHADHAAGLRAIAEAVRLDPDDDWVKDRSALILSFFTENPELRRALRSGRPRAAFEHHARGGELAAAGKWKEAIAEWEAALGVDPAFADCHYNVGLAAAALGDLARAESEYVLALALYAPEESRLRADALNNLVYARVRRGRAGPEDVGRAREAIALDRESPAKLDTLARACDVVGDRACALDAYAKLAATREPVPDEVRRNAEERLRALRGAAAPGR